MSLFPPSAKQLLQTFSPSNISAFVFWLRFARRRGSAQGNKRFCDCRALAPGGPPASQLPVAERRNRPPWVAYPPERRRSRIPSCQPWSPLLAILPFFLSSGHPGRFREFSLSTRGHRKMGLRARGGVSTPLGAARGRASLYLSHDNPHFILFHGGGCLPQAQRDLFLPVLGPPGRFGLWRRNLADSFVCICPLPPERRWTFVFHSRQPMGQWVWPSRASRCNDQARAQCQTSLWASGRLLSISRRRLAQRSRTVLLRVPTLHISPPLLASRTIAVACVSRCMCPLGAYCRCGALSALEVCL